MEYLLDTINLDDISRFCEYLPISGVTSNPSIIKKEGSIDFFSHMRQIRSLIGKEKTFHIQVTAEDTDGMLKDAEAILRHVDEGVSIKVPINWNGLKAMKHLKSQGVSVTGTAIYTINQGFLALEAGADYIAPYYNRMESLNIDPVDGIRAFASMIKQYGYGTKILAASFRNIAQVNKRFWQVPRRLPLSPLYWQGLWRCLTSQRQSAISPETGKACTADSRLQIFKRSVDSIHRISTSSGSHPL